MAPLRRCAPLRVFYGPQQYVWLSAVLTRGVDIIDGPKVN